MEGAVRCAQRIRLLLSLVARKDAVLAPADGRDIDPPALHEKAGESLPVLPALERAFAEAGIEQTEQPRERCFVAAVRGRREQDQLTLGIAGEALEQLETLLAALVRADAGMGLVRRTCSSLVIKYSVSLGQY